MIRILFLLILGLLTECSCFILACHQMYRLSSYPELKGINSQVRFLWFSTSNPNFYHYSFMLLSLSNLCCGVLIRSVNNAIPPWKTWKAWCPIWIWRIFTPTWSFSFGGTHKLIWREKIWTILNRLNTLRKFWSWLSDWSRPVFNTNSAI